MKLEVKLFQRVQPRGVHCHHELHVEDEHVGLLLETHQRVLKFVSRTEQERATQLIHEHAFRDVFADE